MPKKKKATRVRIDMKSFRKKVIQALDHLFDKDRDDSATIAEVRKTLESKYQLSGVKVSSQKITSIVRKGLADGIIKEGPKRPGDRGARYYRVNSNKRGESMDTNGKLKELKERYATQWQAFETAVGELPSEEQQGWLDSVQPVNKITALNSRSDVQQALDTLIECRAELDATNRDRQRRREVLDEVWAIQGQLPHSERKGRQALEAMSDCELEEWLESRRQKKRELKELDFLSTLVTAVTERDAARDEVQQLKDQLQNAVPKVTHEQVVQQKQARVTELEGDLQTAKMRAQDFERKAKSRRKWLVGAAIVAGVLSLLWIYAATQLANLSAVEALDLPTIEPRGRVVAD